MEFEIYLRRYIIYLILWTGKFFLPFLADESSETRYTFILVKKKGKKKKKALILSWAEVTAQFQGVRITKEGRGSHHSKIYLQNLFI